MNLFNNPTVLALKKDLDVQALRQRVIADNVANSNTPGFKKSFVSFEEQLQTAMGKNNLALRTTHSSHIGGVNHPALVEPQVVQVTNTSLTPDGNNVNAEEEMVNLVVAQLKYDISAQGLSGHYSNLNHVIIGGR